MHGKAFFFPYEELNSQSIVMSNLANEYSFLREARYTPHTFGCGFFLLSALFSIYSTYSASFCYIVSYWQRLCQSQHNFFVLEYAFLMSGKHKLLQQPQDGVLTFWGCCCSRSCCLRCSKFCCCSCSASWWKSELFTDSGTNGLKWNNLNLKYF